MSTVLDVGVAGIGAFVQGAPDWTRLRGVLLGQQELDPNAPTKPAAAKLPAAERRRAPDGVRLAAEVSEQACAMAHCDPATLPCVFASTHGEVGITDYVCATLAAAPQEMSPTKFHNSVLNAPAGYWTIATGCTAASNAVSAWRRTLGAGLLEAAVFACSEGTPVLFAHGDVAAAGPLVDIMQIRALFGMALVLTPRQGETRMRLALRAVDADPPVPESVLALQAVASDNPASAQALALLAALAKARPAHVQLPLANGLSLDMEINA
ncbi:MAG TPA: beta-ketoacyl synthase chain length factor [Rhodanobacteraceae bacterium]|nr:beta-ketoacyl synthase chain length factor [Rhodanobacteraceae bacterium]